MEKKESERFEGKRFLFLQTRNDSLPDYFLIMFALRASRLATRSAVTAISKRGYAEAVGDKLKLSLVLPHDVSTLSSLPPCSTLILLSPL